jgi:flagellar biosynthesis protein FlhF
MRIRTIAGATLQEAMAKVREELGSEALILDVEDTKSRKGVLIRAAAEAQDASQTYEPAKQSALDVIENRLESELRQRLRVFQPMRAAAERIDPEAEIVPALNFHRLTSGLVLQLSRVAAEAAAAVTEDALAHAMERSFGCAPMPNHPARPVIVVGAPGHGKTTTLARLAANAIGAGSQATLVTLDTGKAGAVAQIETYGNLLKARVIVCEDEDALRRAVMQTTAGAIFVDTPGINPWSADDAAQLRRWIEAAGAEPVWVVSAETDPEDMAEAASLYRSLGARRMIATKLDAARRLGGILAAAVAGPLMLAGTVSSPFLAEGIEQPNHIALAQRLLDAFRTQISPLSAKKEANVA